MSSQLASDKELATSLRWMAKDKKNAFKNLIIRILEKMGINQQEWTASACLLNKGVSQSFDGLLRPQSPLVTRFPR